MEKVKKTKRANKGTLQRTAARKQITKEDTKIERDKMEKINEKNRENTRARWVQAASYGLTRDFVLTINEMMYVLNYLLITIKAMNISKGSSVYFCCTNQLSRDELFELARNIYEIEACDSQSAKRALRQHVMTCLKGKGKKRHITPTELRANKNVSFEILFGSTSGDGGGVHGVEGGLMDLIQASSGGYATRSLLNIKQTGGGRLREGMFCACVMMVIRGGLDANGLEFQGKDENKVRDRKHTELVIPEPDQSKLWELPRPSGATWRTSSETNEEFYKRMVARSNKWNSLTSTERWAYKLGVLTDYDLNGREAEIRRGAVV